MDDHSQLRRRVVGNNSSERGYVHSQVRTWNGDHQPGNEGLATDNLESTHYVRTIYRTVYDESDMLTTRHPTDDFIRNEDLAREYPPSYSNLQGTSYNSNLWASRNTPSYFIREERQTGAMQGSGGRYQYSPNVPRRVTDLDGNVRLMKINEGVDVRRTEERTKSMLLHNVTGPVVTRVSRHASMRLDSSSDGSIAHLIRYYNTPLYQHYYTDDTSHFLEQESSTKKPIKATADSKKEAPEVKKEDSKTSLIDFESARPLLWAQMPQVIKSGVLEGLSPELSKIQHIKFELLTSEASYYSSLAVLEMHFACSLHLHNDSSIISKTEHKYLFGHVVAVRKVSEKIVRSLNTCFEKNVMMHDMPLLILKNASDEFKTAYVRYCRNLTLGLETYDKLTRENEKFSKELRALESSKNCQNLKLNSFLILPMQRILRMPLLVEAILAKLPKSHKEYKIWQDVLENFKKISEECNTASGEVEDIHKKLIELKDLESTLHYHHGVHALSIVSASRSLLLNDTFKHHTDKSKSKKHHTEQLLLYLFSDYLLVTKPISAQRRDVQDYCTKEQAWMERIEDESHKNCIKLTLEVNHKKKTQEMILEASDTETMDKWLKTLVRSHSLQTEAKNDPYREKKTATVHSHRSWNPFAHHNHRA